MKSNKTKAPELVLKETKFNLRLGDKIYTLNFGTATFKRIRLMKPELTTAFHAMDELPAYEAIPLLIEAAIRPEDRNWTSEDDFLELYDSCDDQAIDKVVPAYVSAVYDMTKKLTPVLAGMAAMQKESEAK